MSLSISENVSLREYTTFRIGGVARYFCEVKTEDELLEAVQFSEKNGVPFFVLGGGSNVLISDEGFSGLVIKMAINGVDFGHDKIIAGAGENWDDLVSECVTRGLCGLENLSGIPGTVGAAPVQNIGAYGSEAKDTIQSVRVFDAEKNIFIDLANAECHFEYRDSIFKKNPGRYIVVSVTFILKKDGSPNIQYKDLQEYFQGKVSAEDKSSINAKAVREAVLSIRARKLPDVRVIGTAGSFFKNPIIPVAKYLELKKKYPDMPSYPVAGDSDEPDESYVKVPTAWILDHICGYKGLAKGNIGTYKNQALVMVNNGSATAKEVKDFANELAAQVKEKTGIVIEPEVQYVG